MSRHCVALLSVACTCWSLLWLLLPCVSLADAPGDQSERAASLRRLQAKAGEFRVSRMVSRDELLKLNATPLLRYTDPPNGYRDAAVWIWEQDGFPLVLAKVEDRDSQQAWQFCVASLAPDNILVARPGQPAWQSRAPGIDWEKISDVPVAATTNPVRRLQAMKALARRFTGKFQSGATDNREEMRPLPRPIHRFSSPQAGLLDGTIFAHAVSGTNPTVLVVIGLREKRRDEMSRQWEYGVVGLTADAAAVYFDDQMVWSKPANYSKRFYDRWYFHQEQKAQGAGPALR